METRTPRSAGRQAAFICAIAVGLSATACIDPEPPGSPTCRRGSARITVFQGPDGHCIPPGEVVGYRCPDADPVVVFDEGTKQERRFLGGSFAVTVPRLPRSAELLGVGDDAQLIGTHGSDRRLYTIRGGSVLRWLALPSARRIPSPPSAYLLGDSLLDGGAPAIAAALPTWTVEVDAEPGRGSASGAAIVASRGGPDPVVVVELGTNDRNVASFEQNARRILDAVDGSELVLWQTVEGPPEVVPAAELNSVISSLVGQRPDAAIVDWAEEVPDEMLGDGVHPDPEHQGAMAELIAPMLERWFAGVTEPPACR